MIFLNNILCYEKVALSLQLKITLAVNQYETIMNITYKNKKLKRFAEDYKYSVQKLGPNRSELYVRRIGDLTAAETLEDVKYLPGNWHDLKGNRKGEWACDLDQPYRLIFVPHENPIPTTPDGQYIWSEIKGVEIIDIIDYHEK